jgi:hypothetical protein
MTNYAEIAERERARDRRKKRETEIRATRGKKETMLTASERASGICNI